MAKKSKVEKTRNAGTMTESAFWSFLRSGLRRQFRFWKPMLAAKQAARREYTGTNKRQKFEFQCNHCKEWFPDKKIQIDHVIPVGSLLCWEDVTPFLKNLIPEDIKRFQVLCLDCHQAKTNKEREARNSDEPAPSRKRDTSNRKRKDSKL